MQHSSKIFSLLFFAIILSWGIPSRAQITIKIDTKNISLIFFAEQDGKLQQGYFGKKLSDRDVTNIRLTGYDAFPSFGTTYINEAALRVVHGDGNTSTELVYQEHHSDTLTDGTVQTEIRLKDMVYPFFISLFFKVYPEDDMLRQWTEISHSEKESVILYDYASSHLFFNESAYFLTQFYGSWGDEMNMTEVRLTRGQKVLDSKLGVRVNEHAHASFFLSLNHPAMETTGEVVGGTFAWPGNWKLLFDVDEKEHLHVITGINSYAGQLTLKKNSVITTPALLFTWSDQGTGQISRNFHRWARKYGIFRGDRDRYTLLNNWEATYFDFNQEILTGIIRDASEMGFELFLLDDGWFGDKYPRNSDNAGLGDWMVNPRKLPDGLGYLVREAEKNGIKFGIWLEPEMVNPESELYKKHPDWVIGQPNRPIHLKRNQLNLDLSNPKVQEHVFNVIDKTMSENPGIAYIKWDCNRFVTNGGSYYLKPEYQSHLWTEYVYGLYDVLEKVREKYPEVSMMVCSGGGGRIDYGTMPYFDEFWISDNTDALSRIFIQWGTTQFYPAMALASHVSVVPNHTTGRITPLKFRFDVAMSAKLGMDLQPADMTENEKAFSKNAIREYDKIRKIVQFGDLYRLLSPYTSERTSMMYVSEDRSEAVVFSYLLEKNIQGNTQSLVLNGLDPDAMYQLTEINKDPKTYSWFTPLEGKVFSGDFLMKYGLRFTMYNQFDSKIILLKAQ
ncbi:MAG: alpha-galactosidase [Bacteroidales bacterium]|nr:alpha-galactosidase [Bacteroidales bacterium]